MQFCGFYCSRCQCYSQVRSNNALSWNVKCIFRTFYTQIKVPAWCSHEYSPEIMLREISGISISIYLSKQSFQNLATSKLTQMDGYWDNAFSVPLKNFSSYGEKCEWFPTKHNHLSSYIIHEHSFCKQCYTYNKNSDSQKHRPISVSVCRLCEPFTEIGTNFAEPSPTGMFGREFA